MYSKLMYFSGDYDECSFIPSVCRSDQLCQNYPGTYRCYCSSPRALDINGVCRGKLKYDKTMLHLCNSDRFNVVQCLKIETTLSVRGRGD